MWRLTNFASSSINWLRRLGPDRGFDPCENLYRAVDPRHVEIDGRETQLSLSAINFPTLSVNRSRYSRPRSVLIEKRRNWRPWKFKYSDTPTDISFTVTDRARKHQIDTFSFSVEHDPKWFNYSHSEVRTYRNGERHERTTPRTVKLKFREKLRRKMHPCF